MTTSVTASTQTQFTLHSPPLCSSVGRSTPRAPSPRAALPWMWPSSSSDCRDWPGSWGWGWRKTYPGDSLYITQDDSQNQNGSQSINMGSLVLRSTVLYRGKMQCGKVYSWFCCFKYPQFFYMFTYIIMFNFFNQPLMLITAFCLKKPF